MEQADPLSSLFDRAKSHRVPMAEICRRAEIDPTTPSRWKRKKNGATLEKVTQLNAALNDIIAESERAAA
jgi:hypothetical protein